MRIAHVFPAFLFLVLACHGGRAISSESSSSETLPLESFIDDEISRMVYRANKTDEEIINSGQVFAGDKVTAYLNAIMDKLYPDYKGVFSVRIYISTDVNAFVLANGSVYINIGLLAKAGNEAQIAAILAHEGAHYVHNHILQTQQNLKNIASGADSFGLERTLSYLSDYSIELELQADNAGFQRLVSARYDPNEAANIFKSMAGEAALYEKRERGLYNTHPKMLERIEYFNQLSRGHSGFVGKEAYVKLTSDVRIMNYELNLSKYRYNSVLSSLEDKSLSDEPLQAWFYLGEAYRQRGEPGDAMKAEKAYLRAIERVPGFAPPYAALGILYMKNRERANARKYFEKYLAMSPGAKTSGYIREYYRQIKHGKAAQ